MQELIKKVQEACAKVCEDQMETGMHLRCAAAIRARDLSHLSELAPAVPQRGFIVTGLTNEQLCMELVKCGQAGEVYKLLKDMSVSDEQEQNDPGLAAIEFALSLDDAQDMELFLLLWNEGNFESCRINWPKAPEECYIGADPLLKRVQAAQAPQALHSTITPAQALARGTRPAAGEQGEEL